MEKFRCPVCRYTPILYQGSYRFWIICSKLNHHNLSIAGESKEEAIENWIKAFSERE